LPYKWAIGQGKSEFRNNGMKFYNPIYFGDTVKKPDKIRRRLQHGKCTFGIYLLLWDEESARLELYNSAVLLQPFFQKKELFVIGIANGEEEGISLIQRIVDKSVKQLGCVDLATVLFGEEVRE
jgi:hypothetical protein